MASKWIEEGMVPTNIMFRNGRPVAGINRKFKGNSCQILVIMKEFYEGYYEATQIAKVFTI